MATAAGQVLNVAELLERILLSLPMKDILLDQRVATFWKHLIKSSPKIQKALFYQPDYNVETWEALDFSWNVRSDVGHNSIIVEAVTLEMAEANRSAWAAKSTLVVSGRPNPLLIGYREEDMISRNGTMTPVLYSTVTDNCKVLISRKEFEEWYDLSEEAQGPMSVGTRRDFKPSWCDMFLTQPPTKRLRFDVEPYADMGEYGPDGDDVRCDEGITCGMLMEELLDECGSSSINEARAQFIEIKQPCIIVLPYLTATGGFDNFRKLLDLCGSKQALSEFVEKVGNYNTETVLQGDNFERLTRYGLMGQVDRDEGDAEIILREHEHQPGCWYFECTGCKAVLGMSSSNCGDSEESLLE